MRPLLVLDTNPALIQHEVHADLSLAKLEISVAWEQYKRSTIKRFKDGLDLGRVCQEWRARYRAQGSRSGKGFENLLERLAIPKTTAYRWIRRHEMKNGLSANWNEVEHNSLNRRIHSPSSICCTEKRRSFTLLLEDKRRQQFDEDVKTLGGHNRVAEMVLDFVSQKASERRAANAVKRKSGESYEGGRHMIAQTA
jgi:hypothetical protein